MAFPRNIFVALLVAFTACNAFAEQYSGLQLSARDISTLAALKVTPEYVQEMRSYFPNISAKDITSLYALKVTPEYLKEMRTHFSEISVKDVTSLYALKVPPVYLKDMRAHFPDMSIRDVTSLYALKVPPSYVKEIRDLGYDDITTREITSFYALKVKPDYIEKMRKAGKVAGHQVHVPKINVEVPEIDIPNIQVHVSPHHGDSHSSMTWATIFKVFAQIAGAIAVILMLGFFARLIIPKVFTKRTSVVDDNIDSRISDFEQRVNDLQDILLSIDARIDRRIHQN